MQPEGPPPAHLLAAPPAATEARPSPQQPKAPPPAHLLAKAPPPEHLRRSAAEAGPQQPTYAPPQHLLRGSTAMHWLDGGEAAPAPAREWIDEFDGPEREQENEADERGRLARGLQRGSAAADEHLTIASLTSVDTIPLGTDLDPMNGYDNLWAAKNMKNKEGGLLVRFNLQFRVIDGENVGFSYNQVVNKSKGYAVEGVRKAVAYFRAGGYDVIVVSKREETANIPFGEGVQVVINDKNDDVMVLKQAYKMNCPVVSRDKYNDWQDDLRIDAGLRQWMKDAARLQVRWSWGPAGEFEPDFDLPRPVLRPNGAEGWEPQACHQCRSASSQGSWASWRGERFWYCNACWQAWAER